MSQRAARRAVKYYYIQVGPHYPGAERAILYENLPELVVTVSLDNFARTGDTDYGAGRVPPGLREGLNPPSCDVEDAFFSARMCRPRA
ncbi:MAG: hypothetical protein JXQ75_18070 [Phycisphaerae bacterium]|nr:hypothetical protein [Phycisphaerae bacterium]